MINRPVPLLFAPHALPSPSSSRETRNCSHRSGPPPPPPQQPRTGNRTPLVTCHQPLAPSYPSPYPSGPPPGPPISLEEAASQGEMRPRASPISTGKGSFLGVITYRPVSPPPPQACPRPLIPASVDPISAKARRPRSPLPGIALRPNPLLPSLLTRPGPPNITPMRPLRVPHRYPAHALKLDRPFPHSLPKPSCVQCSAHTLYSSAPLPTSAPISAPFSVR